MNIALRLRRPPVASLILLAMSFLAPVAHASLVNIDFQLQRFTSTRTSANSLPAHTYVVDENGSHEVFPTVADTAFTQSVSGSAVEFYFENPAPQTRNRLSFTPGPAMNVNVGDEFLFGTFHFANGIWFGIADIAFSMFTVSHDPQLNGHAFNGIFRMVQTAFNPDPALSADYFYLLDDETKHCHLPGPQSNCNVARVYELFDSPLVFDRGNGLERIEGLSNAGSIELWGRIGSLIPTAFRNPRGALFLDTVSVPGQPTPATEPATLALLSFGLFGFFIARRRATVAL